MASYTYADTKDTVEQSTVGSNANKTKDAYYEQAEQSYRRERNTIETAVFRSPGCLQGFI
jgi:hypothetical protein